MPVATLTDMMDNALSLIAPTGLFLDFSGYVKENPEFVWRISEGLTEVIDIEEKFGKPYSIVLISTQPDEVNAVALVKASQKVATVRFRVKVLKVIHLEYPLRREEIEQHFPKKRGLPWKAYWSGQHKLISQGAWEGLLAYLEVYRPNIHQGLVGLRSHLALLLQDASSDIQQDLVDASAAAYKLAGLSGHEGLFMAAARSADGVEDLMQRPISYVSLYEDQMLFQDLGLFSGWAEANRYSYSSTVFRDGNRAVQIYNVNRGDLEHKLGVDLIYHDLNRKIFVLVQYKRMTVKHQNDWGYYPSSDTSLAKELARMDQFEKKLDNPDSGQLSDYRYNPDLFYFKFCPKLQSPDGHLLTQGMYITKAHLQRMLGPDNPSKLIHFPAGQGYLNNTLFIDLFKTGMIGCHAKTAAQVQSLIEAALGLGHSVIYAEGRRLG